ncbi:MULTISPECIES: GTP 3',8-cyclase MoaA [Rhizobium/Agrobacterium group]|uniref:GTP 3',8-cyclase MoaA n=1 Tax=Rhizobium/Agrobacterium group TaxID=227290 RepID=UPI000B3F7CAF|nr:MULTISPECIES: GTP 3',8-cyclase MoaA [Rhizobium/Agrobacterium group]NSZ46093.1 GTP 3',8-cyclase MoaA [Agrobacterium vitis]NTA29841.1 GTP 3',8-cyclase MoaA [Allorhizobium ampelinum]OVE87859.1 GTP 3',8-cyclase MoaA [Allorhizobium ampelinum]
MLTRGTALPSCGLIDRFGRRVTYLRLSVTDRCDLRCMYCMPENMTFMPKRDVLSIDELERLAVAFIRSGVTRIRLTGGEPLVRKGIIDLIRSLGRNLQGGPLQELTLTTNGTQLARYAEDLAQAGIRRLNVSLDTLAPERFRTLTRGGSLTTVLEGIDAARAAGLAVKINSVALRDSTEEEIHDLIAFAHGRGMMLSLIETMPLGDIGVDRIDQYLPLNELRKTIETRWSLTDIPLRTGGPARYARIAETGGTIGFITPLTHNFCEGCNRVRVTAAGVLHTCLGQEDAVDLKAVMRRSPHDQDLFAAINQAILDKSRGHDFAIDRTNAPITISRHMSATGG